ncbi:MAG: IclR family transcriptional regulator [Acidobacteriaceae bacterium]
MARKPTTSISRKPNTAGTQKAIRHRIPKWALEKGDGVRSSDEQYYLRSIGRALDVLDCFGGVNPLSLKEISLRVKLPESSLFRVLLTLEKHGYLRQEVDGTYHLARKLIFGWLVVRADTLRETARAEMEKLANQFNETVSLAYLYDDRIHVLDSMESFHEIRMSNKPGRVLPPHCSAMGKAIVAFQDRALSDRILEVYGLTRRTDATITDRRQLFQQFEGIRATGIAYDREESNTGGLCIGAAICPPDQQVVSAISISTPLVRMTRAREQEIRTAVSEAAVRIAKVMAGK